MTGRKDIDGSMVMAGSPGIIGCLTVQFEQILGSLPGQREKEPPPAYRGQPNLEALEKLAKRIGDEDFRQRIIAAAELVVLAQRLLEYPTGRATSLPAAQKAVRAIRQAVREAPESTAKYDDQRGEYWWRKVDCWGRDGSET